MISAAIGVMMSQSFCFWYVNRLDQEPKSNTTRLVLAIRIKTNAAMNFQNSLELIVKTCNPMHTYLGVSLMVPNDFFY